MAYDMHIKTGCEITVLASGSHGNCYVIRDGTHYLVVECGYKWDNVLEWFGYKMQGVVDGVLVSHEHADHAKYIRKAFEDYCCDVYASQGTLEALGLWEEYRNFHLKVLKHGEQKQIGTFTVMPFSTEHDCAEPLGFLIYCNTSKEKILFATDTFYLRWQFKGLTQIMIECNYQQEVVEQNIEAGLLDKRLLPRLVESHMSLETCLEFLGKQDLSEVKKIYLLHLSDGNSNADECRKAVITETGIPTVVAPKYFTNREG